MFQVLVLATDALCCSVFLPRNELIIHILHHMRPEAFTMFTDYRMLVLCFRNTESELYMGRA